jgi:MFS family permease
VEASVNSQVSGVEHPYGRRWWALLVLCLSLVVIGMDNTILNVALPTLARDLSATASELQWMVDSYILVFAGLLLTMGALGDRFGRKLALNIGLLVFVAGSVASAFAGSAGVLIFSRAAMGIGGALIMPSTLSIITNVFPARERGRAIGVWAGVAGFGIVLGPVIGGWLLEHFWWGSVFLVNVPVVAVAILAGWASRPPGRPRSPEADRAILDAAIDLFIDEGYEGMSIEGVAARAGVGKTTIYRRWASKEELIVAAIDELIFEVEPLDTGSLRRDLVDVITQLQVVMSSSRAGQVFPRMVPHVAAGTQLGRVYLQRVIAPRFELLRSVLARAAERGEVPADLDPELVRGLLVGPIMIWKLTGQLTRRGARQRAEAIVDTVLRGLGARG